MTTATKVSSSLEETAPIQSLLSTVVEKTSNFLNSDQDEEVKKLLTTHTHTYHLGMLVILNISAKGQSYRFTVRLIVNGKRFETYTDKGSKMIDAHTLILK